MSCGIEAVLSNTGKETWLDQYPNKHKKMHVKGQILVWVVVFFFFPLSSFYWYKSREIAFLFTAGLSQQMWEQSLFRSLFVTDLLNIKNVLLSHDFFSMLRNLFLGSVLAVRLHRHYGFYIFYSFSCVLWLSMTSFEFLY